MVLVELALGAAVDALLLGMPLLHAAGRWLGIDCRVLSCGEGERERSLVESLARRYPRSTQPELLSRKKLNEN